MKKELVEELIKFRDDRSWKQYHNAKDLAISISLEASELLENFQWSETDEAVRENGDHIAEELADVLMYCYLLADILGLDVDEIVKLKLEKNNQKYPVDRAYGNKTKYTHYSKETKSD